MILNKQLCLILLLIAIIFLHACKRDNNCGDLSDVITNYNIADSNKAKIPYTGTDTLVFVSNANDTVTLIGRGKNTHYESVRNSLNGNSDCPKYEVIKYENIDINFISNNDTLITSIYYKVYHPIHDVNYTYINLYLNTKGLSSYPFELLNNKVFEDSVLVKNKYIKGYYIDSNRSQVLYNYQKGIIKFIDFTNKSWTIN